MKRQRAPRAVLRALAALAAIAALSALLPVLPASSAGLLAQEAGAYRGAVATGLALRRLGNTARLLHIGAHPDDENTALFTPLALGAGADVAYLSLTRGEGGQNGIGPELGTALGLIRTEELLAARRVDGATQFFTRAVDFGFSKSAEETFTHWPKDSVLADVVAVIRYYRPDVVVSVWSGTRRDGHGQHEASGILAREAVLAAGDPDRFPEQIAAGLRPHTVALYYWSARYGEDGPDVELDTGTLDPLLGRSYHQVAMASRSLHRSQDMGVRQAPGPRRTAFDRIDPAHPPEVRTGGPGPGRQLEGAARESTNLFAGLSALLSERAAAADIAPSFIDRLRRYERDVERARTEFDAMNPSAIVPVLLGSRMNLESVRRMWAVFVDSLPEPRAALLDFQASLEHEARDLEAAMLAATGLVLDVVADRELLTPGSTVSLELSAWNGGRLPVAVEMEPALPDGWSVEAAPGTNREPGLTPVPAGERVVRTFVVRVPPDAPLTRPYYLPLTQQPGDPADDRPLYGWPEGLHVGFPLMPGPVGGRFLVDYQPHMLPGRDGEPRSQGPQPFARFTVDREAAWIGVDARSGEFRRPVRVVPRISVSVEPQSAVIPRSALGHPDRGRLAFRAVVRSEVEGGTTVRVRPAPWEGWTATPESVEVSFDDAGQERTVSFTVVPPSNAPAGEYAVGAIVDADGCGGTTPCAAAEVYAHGYDLVDYPHIAPHHLYRPATARVRVLDVEVAAVRVGYVEGVADGVPEALAQLDLQWEALDAAALADADLAAFDVIIAGTRAYELRPDLVANNHRLLEWARAGGTLISLYNKYPALEGSYAPWPVSIARPHGRVTDETAPVTILERDHPIFTTPNPIEPADWEGWVQERGLYFWDAWEGPLRPLLAMSDPGEAPLEGSLLVAPLGEGIYVYTALALFRQLPAGVPGAYRLLANLVSLGAAP